MSVVTWIIVGFVSGFLISKFVNGTAKGLFLDISVGIVGAVIGGWLYSTFGISDGTGINLYDLLVAVLGAIVLLVAYRTAFRKAR
jgi:uncharacterized membrane protein YeaQ/YmgE (transglycosylase-associated protein family)